MKTVRQILSSLIEINDSDNFWISSLEKSLIQQGVAKNEADVLLQSLVFGLSHYKKSFCPIILRLNRLSGNFSKMKLSVFYHLKAYHYWKQHHNIVPALEFLNRSLRILPQTEEGLAYRSRVHDTIGQILFQISNDTDALKEYEISLSFRAADDTEGKAITLGNLARMHMRRGNYKEALAFFENDLDLLLTNNDTPIHIQAQIRHSIAECQFRLNKTDYFKQLNISEQLNRDNQNKIGLCFNALLYAHISLSSPQQHQTPEYLSRAQQLLQTDEIPMFLRNYLLIQYTWLEAKYFVQQNKIDKAVLAFEKAKKMYASDSQFSPADYAALLIDYAAIVPNKEKADLLKEALETLDATDLSDLRKIIEIQLKKHSYVHWLLHMSGRYLGHRQLEFLLQNTEEEYLGELKDVVILFADIRGFTSVSEKLSASGLVAMLNDFLASMTSAIEYFGGYVDKFIGDAVMAVFSLPHSMHDDAERAANAALLMKESLVRFNRYLPEHLPKLKIGIGIHCGEVVAGLIGSLQKRSYTVIGDAVNTASRLEGMTKQLGAGILISSNVAIQIPKEKFLLRSLGSYSPKGRGQSIAVFDLECSFDQDASLEDLLYQSKEVENALLLFKSREFEKASDAFLNLFEKYQKEERSIGYNLLYQYSRKYEMNPPGYEWDGAIKLVNK